MVGGRQVLLSIAVLSGLGFEHVLGDRVRRQDGPINFLQHAPGGASSSAPSQAEVAPPSQSPATVASVAADSGASTSSPAHGEAQTASSSAPDTTVLVDVVIATSTGGVYVDPGAFGAGGQLTTDTNAPTRTNKPTRTSIAPGSGANRGPPPADPVSSVAPGVPGPEDSGFVYGAVTTTAQATATTPATTATTAAQADTTDSTELGYVQVTSTPTTFLTSTTYGNQTITVSPSVSVSYCTDSAVATTFWSVVYTSTVTWYGNPTDYKPPYPPITIPAPSASCIVPVDPPRFTISICASTGTDSKYRTCDAATTTMSFNFGIQTASVPPVVFLTTDKNPAVVYSTINTPNYGVSQDPKTRDNHMSPSGPGAAISTAAYNSQNAAQGQTQVVIVAGQTFTIDPTRVVGAGATIDRPSATGGPYVPVPTSTDFGSVPVVVSSSVAVIGGSSFTLGPTPTTAIVSGQTFTIGASTIAAAGRTLPLPTSPSPTEVVVAGGDLITAIGSSVVVIHGTTLTYQLTGPATTLTVDGDAITLGPGGITAAHGGVTLGGPHAASPHDTEYALVGGATITKVGASVVVIQNVTYTVGPGTGTTTTVVGGESVTIAPSGVQVGSTLSLGYPFGATTVITPGAGAGGAAGPTATGAAAAQAGDAEEDGGLGLARPWLC
ncbi:e1b74fc8-28a3-4259-8b01-2a91233133b2 [Thermothielavioides terrestris]|uniref:E1b74fc8-28a3-4259-8b01-2a91233133b2 n=1 Tax=Thermothielavioides terrestris TaxID=2587410 RepID=A0A3S4AKQ5_9PEZI|nr:e1b74fc8-28a3-4259-8b01-2a91233133b2 [Thermothielavioides terrestris]